MSGDVEQEYFSDGISEDIITDLSKVSALAVASRNSAFLYKGMKVDVPKVARELKVSHVLEGSVRRAGGRVRITAQLVDGASNDSIWAERYDRDLNDIFSLQDEISQAIVKALKLKLLPEEKKAIEQRGTENVEAYNLYLMARRNYATGIESDPRRAEASIRLCSRATQIDPNYSRAWALMALGQMLLRFSHGRSGDDGMTAAERALSLDANLAEAHAVKARILSQNGRNDQASAELDAALRLDPESYEVNKSGAYLRVRQRRMGDAIPVLRKSDGPDGNRRQFAGNADDLLLGGRRCRGRRAGSTSGIGTGRDNSRAGRQQWVGDGLWSLCALGPWGRGARQAVDQSRAADRSRQHEHALQLRLLAHDLEGDGRGDRTARPGFPENAYVHLLNHAKVDPDLDPLRSDARSEAMIAAAESRLATTTESRTQTPG